jgi:hypothetical protein
LAGDLGVVEAEEYSQVDPASGLLDTAAAFTFCIAFFSLPRLARHAKIMAFNSSS